MSYRKREVDNFDKQFNAVFTLAKAVIVISLIISVAVAVASVVAAVVFGPEVLEMIRANQ